MLSNKLKCSLLSCLLILLVGLLLLPFTVATQELSPQFSIEWQRYLPGISGASVIQTSDGGYLAIGQDATYDSASQEFTEYTSIIAKTDTSGNIVWTKTISQAANSRTTLSRVVETSDGYILGGTVDPAVYGLSAQFCLIKTNYNGNIIWNVTFTGGDRDVSYLLNDLIVTSDGGAALVGSSYGISPYVPYLYFVKVDSSGQSQINMSLLRSKDTPLSWVSGSSSSLFQTNDTGYIIIGSDGSRPYGPNSIQMINLDSNGDLQWRKFYGGAGDSYHTYATSAIAVEDGYLIGGSAYPSGGPEKAIVIKTGLTGDMEWNQTYSELDKIYTLSEGPSGEYIFLEKISEENTNATYIEAWQIDNLGNVLSQSRIMQVQSYFLFNGPTSLIQTKDGGYVFTGVYGQTMSNPSEELSVDEFWIMKISSSNSTTTSNAAETISGFLPLIIVVAVAIVLAAVIIRWRRLKRQKIELKNKKRLFREYEAYDESNYESDAQR